MTQEKIAKWLGVSQGMLSKMFSGEKRPDPAKAFLYEELTGVPFRKWLGRDSDLQRAVEDAFEQRGKR